MADEKKSDDKPLSRGEQVARSRRRFFGQFLALGMDQVDQVTDGVKKQVNSFLYDDETVEVNPASAGMASNPKSDAEVTDHDQLDFEYDEDATVDNSAFADDIDESLCEEEETASTDNNEADFPILAASPHIVSRQTDDLEDEELEDYEDDEEFGDYVAFDDGDGGEEGETENISEEDEKK